MVTEDNALAQSAWNQLIFLTQLSPGLTILYLLLSALGSNEFKE